MYCVFATTGATGLGAFETGGEVGLVFEMAEVGTVMVVGVVVITVDKGMDADGLIVAGAVGGEDLNEEGGGG